MSSQISMPGSPASSGLLASVDERTNLAGTNKMELLLFNVGSPETYGINVFKVKEVIHTVEITHAPSMPPFVVGMASLRGELVAVLDLVEFCGYSHSDKPPVLIVTEFSGTCQALLVESVETIVRVDWGNIHQPPAQMLTGRAKLTGVTRLADGRLASILDVEQVLHTVAGDDPSAKIPTTAAETPLPTTSISIFFADDSAFARNQLQQILDTMKIHCEFAVNGRLAWERLDAIATQAAASGANLADTWPVIITDIEMPEMDGFMLTRRIKADPRFDGVKVLVHSSMSGSSNQDKGIAMGADGFLAKFNPTEVMKKLNEILSAKGRP